MEKLKNSPKAGSVYKKKRRRITRDDIELFLISLPTALWYILFAYLPLLGVIIAFKQYRLFQGKSFFYSLFASEWVGFDNFKFLFARDDFGLIISRTIGYNLVFIVAGIVVPLTLAIMMSQLLNKKFAKVCQTAAFFPHFMSWVVASYFVFAFLSTQNGLLTRTLASLGVDYNFYGAEANEIWPYLLVMLHLWKTAGYNMVVYLATIAGIDSSYYEAAVIDGATKWQQVKSITLPLMKPIVIIMAIMAVGGIIKSDFGLFYQASKNAIELYPSTLTLDVFIFNSLTQLNNIGMSSAAAFFQSIVGFFTIIAANAVVRKIEPENAFF